jgi:hypothetical protein
MSYLTRIPLAIGALLLLSSAADLLADDLPEPAPPPLGRLGEVVSPVAGGFSQAIPIAVPSYRGLEPRLALGYSSEGGNGFVGPGWGPSGFSTIQRARAYRGAPRYDANDTYLLDGQELIPCTTPGLGPSASCASGGSHTTKKESYLKVSYDSTRARTPGPPTGATGPGRP